MATGQKPDEATPPRSEIDFWRTTGELWISSSLSQLDERANWMVTTAAGITVADSVLLQLLKTVSAVTVTPSLFFLLAVLFFVASLFPRNYQICQYMPKKMKDTHTAILNHKLKFHKLGFASFFAGLLFMIVAALMA